MDIEQFEQCLGKHGGVVHESVEATASRYADDRGIDVVRTFRGELELRGCPVADAEWVDHLVAALPLG